MVSFLRPYCSDSNDMLLCPMAARYDDNKNDPHWSSNESVSLFGMGSKYKAWKRRFGIREGQTLGRNFFFGSYGINDWACGPWKYPAQMPLLLDCAGDGLMPANTHAPPAFEGELRPAGDISWVCIDRHQGTINGLFWDTTVRKVGLKELWTLKWFSGYDTSNRWTKIGGVQPEDWPVWMRGFKDY